MNRLTVLILGIFVLPCLLYSEVTDGIVAHWTFDHRQDSTILDRTGNEFSGTAYNIEYEKGPLGTAAKFNSARASVFFPQIGQKPYQEISSLEQGSISLWFKFQNLGGNVLPILYFGESDTAKAHNSLIIEIGHAEDIRNRKLYFTIVNQRFCFDSKVNLQENTWYHFVAVVSDDGNTGYLNGEEMTDRNYNLGSDASYHDFFTDVPTDNVLSLGFGRYGQQNRFYPYKGSIDDVRIYNRALTSEEVEELYSMGEIKDNTLPDFENVAYGPHERNVLDFWQAESDTKTPVVVFIHGGGFRSGSKEQARSGSTFQYLEQCLNNGISFAAINYRFRETTRLDTIMLDCARAFQFLRSKSDEWNINKEKFASFGGSAGGGASIWLAFHDDLADPDNSDPVLRESTRLSVVGHLNSQASYDIVRWTEILEIDTSLVEKYKDDFIDLYRIESLDELYEPEIVELRAKLDMPTFLDSEDPPAFFQNYNENAETDVGSLLIHHPKHAIYLKNLYDDLGIDSEIDLKITPPDERVNMIDFFMKYLLDPAFVNDKNRDELSIYPNPASDFTVIQLAEGMLARDVDLFDVSGRKISELFYNTNVIGNEIFIQTDRLNSGIYNLRINLGNTLINKKLAVIK